MLSSRTKLFTFLVSLFVLIHGIKSHEFEAKTQGLIEVDGTLLQLEIEIIRDLTTLNTISRNNFERKLSVLEHDRTFSLGIRESLRKVKRISCNNCKLGHLSSSISLFDGLEILLLNDNNLKELPSSMNSLVNLKTLSLDHNKLETLPDTFGQLESLKVLYLSGNGLESLPETFGSLLDLQVLGLSNNKFQILPETFGSLINLQNVDISHNNLKKLPESIGYLKKLESLFVSFNHLSYLPDSLSQNINLIFLNLADNLFKSLPEDVFESFSKLITLNLSRNKLRILPRSIGRLSSLKRLYLESNRLTSFPKSISNLIQNVEMIDIKGNPYLPLTKPSESNNNESNNNESIFIDIGDAFIYLNEMKKLFGNRLLSTNHCLNYFKELDVQTPRINRQFFISLKTTLPPAPTLSDDKIVEIWMNNEDLVFHSAPKHKDYEDFQKFICLVKSIYDIHYECKYIFYWTRRDQMVARYYMEASLRFILNERDLDSSSEYNMRLYDEIINFYKDGKLSGLQEIYFRLTQDDLKKTCYFSSTNSCNDDPVFIIKELLAVQKNIFFDYKVSPNHLSVLNEYDFIKDQDYSSCLKGKVFDSLRSFYTKFTPQFLIDLVMGHINTKFNSNIKSMLLDYFLKHGILIKFGILNPYFEPVLDDEGEVIDLSITFEGTIKLLTKIIPILIFKVDNN